MMKNHILNRSQEMVAKYDKFFITDYNKPENLTAWEAKYRPRDKIPLLFLDDSIVKNAFYSECCWFLPSLMENDSPTRLVKPHKHDYDEVFGLVGSDVNDPNNLCGELEIFLDGEKYLINRSVLIFIPAGLEHGPIRWVRIDKPIFHFGCAMTKKQV
jgi:hypothetical protein